MRSHLTVRWLLILTLLTVVSVAAQTFNGTNPPGSFQDFAFNVPPGTTNLAITVPGTNTAYSHLLLKKGTAPSDTDYDFIALANGQSNAIHLETPEFTVTNYVLRVRTPANSQSHAFTVTVTTNVTDLRSFARPATKPLVTATSGILLSNSWHYFRVDAPTNLPRWRIVLHSTNVAMTPELYFHTNQPPASTNYSRRSIGQNPDTLTFTNNEGGAGASFIGVFLPPSTNSVFYTLAVEFAELVTLNWDPGDTHLGTQVYTNQNLTGGDYYFKITTQNTALGAWRTALNVLSGEAHIYLARTPPTFATNAFKSERAGSDGFVIAGSAFNAGEDWHYMVRADPGSVWALVTGEPFSTSLGVVASDASSGSGNVSVGAEGMRFFQTTMPANIVAWRLWLNGITNSILVKKASVPVPGASDLSQPAQMLVVPNYLVGGELYFVGVPGIPGSTINLDSRQQALTDMGFVSTTNVNVTGYGYTTYRVQVPVDQIAWQVSVVVSNGNPNVAVRRNFVPNEFYNDAYSEVPGMVTDSITLVPPTLSDGTFYITVYGTNAHSFTLQSGNPEITEINFVGMTTNQDTNRVGWRFFKVSNISQQLGALGWDLFLTDFAPGTRIALRRNAAPGIWNYRDPNQKSAGIYDFLSTAEFLQRPGHQADVWYVGVFNSSNALGNFTLVTRELTADPLGFVSDSEVRTDVPPGKWQFFRVDVPPGVLGWDIRLANVNSGLPQLVVRREALPISLINIGFSGVIMLPTWASGNQWAANLDWTARNFSPDGSINENGRILTMGMNRPLEPGTYYVGVIGALNSTNVMSYTVQSRGIGPGLAIQPQTLTYSNSSAMNSLPARDIACYQVAITSNVPSWKVRLAATGGDVLLAAAKDYLPNITAQLSGSVTNAQTAGKKMLKLGNEHFVMLPPANRTNLIPGIYYLLVISEGIVGTNATRIGTADASYVIQSLGPMPETDLGLLETNDITYVGSLEGGESAAFHFQNLPDTLGFELSLEDRVGNPVMVTRGDIELADPGATSPTSGVGADQYGNEGGEGNFLTAGPNIITVSGAFPIETIMIKARLQGLNYPDSSYKLRIRKLVPQPLAFDGGSIVVNSQTNVYQFFHVEVPTNAVGWDIRVTNVLAGSPEVVVTRTYLPLSLITPGFPGLYSNWPSGFMWIADRDWSQRAAGVDGSDEHGRILEMGMGRPLQPGTYYVGVRAISQPMTYTILSRGIGDGFSIPVVDLPFSGGSFTNVLPAREAAYYRLTVPANAGSWQGKVSFLAGEGCLLFLTNHAPSVLTGRTPPASGRAMQKNGNEHFVWTPPNGLTVLPPGPHYFAVASEGVVNTNFNTRIGSGSATYVFESRGELQVVNLGTLGSSDLTNSAMLEGGEVRAYQFTVPADTTSIEARLTTLTGMPVMVLRAGGIFPDPGTFSQVSGPGFVSVDPYGNEGGYPLTIINGDANTNLITLPNPPAGLCTLMVKARGFGPNYNPASYTLAVRALNFTPLALDGGSSVVTNQASGTWRYFRVDVPSDTLGWDLRLVNVTSGFPRIVVRRDILPNSLTTGPWTLPYISTNWPTTNQWAAGADWTKRTFTSDNLTNEDGRILAMGMGQPLEPGRYFIGVINNTGTNALSYTLQSRGIGNGMSLPVTDIEFYGGAVSNAVLLPREAAYYRITVPPGIPGLKVRLAPTVGEAMLVELKDRIPNVDSGRPGPLPLAGKSMQKAGNEHYVLLPSGTQTNISATSYYLAVVSEGVNPASALRIGTASSSYVIESAGPINVVNLGTIGGADLVITNSLEGGESRFYEFTVPPGTPALEARLEDRVGNPMIQMLTNSFLPDPGGTVPNVPQEPYGNEGGVTPSDGHPVIVTVANPTNGVYRIAVKARSNGTTFPEASYTLRVRHLLTPELNFTAEFNTNGLNNGASSLLLDNQRAYFKVVVPTNVNGAPVVGWELNVSQLSGLASIRARKDKLPTDVATGIPFTTAAAIIVPPVLTNGTWYVEVRGSNSTAFTLTSSALTMQRVWAMPGVGQPTTTPGLVAPDFGDSGIDTNGLSLPDDQGIDLEQGRYHFYAVQVTTNNGGLMRVVLEAISGNPDAYLRVFLPPTGSHNNSGLIGSIFDRSLGNTVTEYGNWVPLTPTETRLTNATWYIAVRAVGNANARYRLRLTTGFIQNLDFYTGGATDQIVGGGDWRYFRVQVPLEPPSNWLVTFSQQSGDVVLHFRDTVPPGNGTTVADYRDWMSDAKSAGTFTSYDLPGTYAITTPPLQPGGTYYLGFRGKSDSIFSLNFATGGVTNPPLPTIAFYGGTVTNPIPPNSQLAYRIFAPADALRWRHTSVHSNTVQLYVESGTLPSKVPADDWRSASVPNSSYDRFLNGYPWIPNQNYFLIATNPTAVTQYFSFNMNGSSITADDDADGMLDAWEVQYFSSINQPPSLDYDNDGVSNLNEFLDGTNPNDRTSFRPRLFMNVTNGVVTVDPAATSYSFGTAVTLTATPSNGYFFIGWSGSVTGQANPLVVVMNTNKIITPRFRVPGDDFEQRIPLAGFSVTHSLSSTGASKETGEPNHAGNFGGKSLWWTWTAPASGPVKITTAGSDFRNMLAVYTGAAVNALTIVASNLAGFGTNTSSVTFNATTGTTYQIAVDGYNGASGNVVLNISMTGVLVLGTPANLPAAFQFVINGASGQVLRVEAGTNLTSWTTIATVTNTTGSVLFIDETATNLSRRFYRAVTP
jgi:hypothetical protein